MTLFKSVAIFALLALTFWFSEFIKPAPSSLNEDTSPPLEQIIPTQFADWSEQSNGLPQIVSAEETQSLGKIYSQTLSRVYRNSANHEIILALAYGPNQTNPLRIHKPEVCYPAQEIGRAHV